MNKFILAPQAIDDLHAIWEFIARDNEDAAGRVIEAAYMKCKVLAEHPELGCERHFTAKGLEQIRSFVISDFPNYVILTHLLSPTKRDDRSSTFATLFQWQDGSL
ncbi:MAG: type II toxin-antitoxin system RelE/ParE family toxin [Verrucomicrobiota bacterium]|nr:type II toxin-antitoxin system RelE/ParE family toxin [Verrucomicrobiota bacterium]